MIVLENVSIRLQNQPILNDLHLTIQEGEHLCIFGPNGCGKTTLLKAIVGLLPYQGSITIDGKEVRKMKRQELAQKVGLMSQFTTIAFDYTVYETVMMGRYHHAKQGLWSTVTKADQDKVMECLRLTSLLDLKDQPVNQLSGGQQQRVFLAKVLAQDPEVILLDEPNNHLDIKHQLELVGYLNEWTKKQDKTMIGVFHDLRLGLSLSKQVLFMKDGGILRRGDFLETATKALLEEVFEVDLIAYFQEQDHLWSRLADA